MNHVWKKALFILMAKITLHTKSNKMDVLEFIFKDEKRFWGSVLFLILFAWALTTLVNTILFNINVKKHGWPPYNMSSHDLPLLQAPKKEPEPDIKEDEKINKSLLE